MKLKLFIYCILIFLGVIQNLQAYQSADIWDVLRGEFKLNHEVNRQEVQEQIKWLAAHPGYITKVSQQCEPYIYHIVNEIRARNLPGELALLPMLESAYNPFAYSVVGAAGLWQLMPGTGSSFGLKQDWWYDGRRSIGPSTKAALNYLEYLNKFFKGDWQLAVAAYDAGEGTISRSIKANIRPRQSASFWNLPVPRETSIYVPRFLALAEVMSNPARYNIKLHSIPYQPYFKEVDVGSQIDLNHAATLAEISYKELIRLNPGYNRWTTAPYRPFNLLIPAEKTQRFYLNLSNVPEDKRVSWIKHQVLEGETLSTIATKYHTTVNLIKQLNQLNNNQINPNQTVLIPSSKNTPVIAMIPKTPTSVPLAQTFTPLTTMRTIHIVQHNDNYQKLQHMYGVTADEIQSWNKIADKKPLETGQALIIWKKVTQPKEYIVKRGDSIGMIARLHHTKINTLIDLNPELAHNKIVHPGQKIWVG